MAVEVRPIRSNRDYEAALKKVERLWGAKAGTHDGDLLDVLATLIDSYEAEHYPMDPPDPIEAIKFRIPQSEIVMLEDCRHSPHRDQTEKTLEAMTDFVARVTMGHKGSRTLKKRIANTR